jgi:hypothetical protein
LVCQEAVLRALIIKTTGMPKLVLSPPLHYLIPLTTADARFIFHQEVKGMTIIGDGGFVQFGVSKEPFIPAYTAIATAIFAQLKPCALKRPSTWGSLPPLTRSSSYSSANRSLTLSDFRVNKQQKRTPEHDDSFQDI